MTESVKSSYKFHDGLDQAFLDLMYDGDINYTVQIFDIFLRQTLLEYEQLKTAIENEDGPGTFEIAHKIKPTFAMVGMTSTKELLQKIETCASPEVNFHKIKPLLTEVNDQVVQFIPIIRQELEKMRTFLEQKREDLHDSSSDQET